MLDKRLKLTIFQMSTSMASIDDNTGGRYYAYRCSKVKLLITGN